MIQPSGPLTKRLMALLGFFLVAMISLIATGQSQEVSPIQARVTIMPGRVLLPPQAENPIKLEHYDVQVSVKDNIATTTIEQAFVNQSRQTLEARYLYPLPSDANFSNFTLTINGKAVEGKVMEKDEARQTYFNIVQKLIDPGLLEYVDNKTVQVSIAPIFAGEKKTIKLSYTQILKQDGGLYKYQYSFGNPSVESLAVGKAGLNLTLNTSQPLKTIYSPTHSPVVNRLGDKKATVALDLNDKLAILEKSFVLYFSQDNQTISLNSLVFRDTSPEDGYFLMTLRAPEQLREQKILNKNLVLALDTSGSMSGQKIVQAKEALKYIVNHLHPADRFNIVTFNTDVTVFRNEMMSATSDMKQEALRYIESLEAGGSTNIEGALQTSFQQLPVSPDNRPDYVIFLTDGEPTIGVTDTTGLLEIAAKANTQQARLFNFGVGYDVKTDLLGKLADRHHGSTTYVEPEENLELALNGFYHKIESPVLTNLKLDFVGLGVNRIYPADLGDLFAGSELVIMGRFRHGGTGQVVLTGNMGEQNRTFTYPVQWQAKQTQHASLPRLWAGRRVGYLLDTIHQQGETMETKNEVIALGKKYGIMTPYTSFLAVDPSEASGNRPQPVHPLDAGTPAMSSMDSYHATSGQGAVQLQKSLGAMKRQASAAEMNRAQVAGAPGGLTLGVRTIGPKTFVLSKSGIWEDTDYDAAKHGPPQAVLFGTSGYFKLLTEHPELAQYFSLGNQVMVVIGEKAYRVTLPSTDPT